MGSTGTGSFSDYPGSKPKNGEQTGGSSGQDNCGKAFSTNLEEVEICSYYKNLKTVPPAGHEVSIYFNKRLIVKSDGENLDIGFLPTKFNYILICIESGYTYKGIVTKSSRLPFPTVTIDIAPEK